jgi:TRAP-type C4-dicarboxylate transport system permease small subunit
MKFFSLKFKKIGTKTLSVVGISMFILYCYLAYNTYYFSKTMGNQCTCADKWQKYFIYGQSIITVIILLLTSIVIVFGRKTAIFL